ncbi:DEAD/DEAH box helicase [Acidithrix ferrooxidans]|uniref:RNA polymerase-associated protein RapA n=1 Tax=Acidithrix ferrooxidans TaxID=1280514 RepID=A0A0D8HIB4_9ACTN|nr:DEAD/DEAH box helicase [Acidithrix ferrooxidans]KJF17594.1 RNA polymerase-associated protein RapA [Acidithrix ferrooxidans]
MNHFELALEEECESLKRHIHGERSHLPQRDFARPSLYSADVRSEIDGNNSGMIPLYNFQREGVEWLSNNTRILLADDMGLGKTVQVLSAIERMIGDRRINRVLIIVPRTLIGNWLDIASRFTPSLCVSACIAPEKSIDYVWHAAYIHNHVTVTSYEVAQYFSKAASKRFDLLVADEAHRIKNPATKRTKAIGEFETQRMWLLTGTPLERHPEDYINLMVLLDQNKFSKRDLNRGLPTLRNRAAPYILRRNKAEVLSQLPPLTERSEILELSEAQRKSYELVIRRMNNRNHLADFNELRSVCDFDPVTKESSKIDRTFDIINNAITDNESVVIFSFWRGLLKLANDLVNEKFNDIPKYLLTAETSSAKRQELAAQFGNSGGIFLASGKIGSEGLTLTRANHAIFLNQWWNPSQNHQAADRIRRIGQDKPTFVYKFTCRNTIEEAIKEIHARKDYSSKILVEALSETISTS